jgi:hypothetical protein
MDLEDRGKGTSSFWMRIEGVNPLWFTFPDRAGIAKASDLDPVTFDFLAPLEIQGCLQTKCFFPDSAWERSDSFTAGVHRIPRKDSKQKQKYPTPYPYHDLTGTPSAAVTGFPFE